MLGCHTLDSKSASPNKGYKEQNQIGPKTVHLPNADFQ
jgi:hypothetical protein